MKAMRMQEVDLIPESIVRHRSTHIALAMSILLLTGFNVHAASIAAGTNHALQLRSGQLYSWGANVVGTLGNGSANNSRYDTPVLVSGLPGGVTIVDIAAGNGISLAKGSNGTVYFWGRDFGQSIGAPFSEANVPGLVTNQVLPKPWSIPSGVTPLAFAAGNFVAMLSTSDGTIYKAGYGWLTGAGSQYTTLRLPGGVKASAISVESDYALLLGDDGRVYSVGSNTYGQLGSGSVGGSKAETPVLVSMPGGVVVVAIATAAGGSYALTADGSVYQWGLQIGTDCAPCVIPTSGTPSRVDLPAGTKAVAISTAGNGHVMVLADNGRVYAWGGNVYGQLGDGTVVSRTAPVQVSIPNDSLVREIAGGGHFSAAITVDGKLYTWGYNQYGQLGDGLRLTPVPQSITVQGPGTLQVGGAGASISATSSSGLPVSLAATSPAICRIDAGTVAPVAAGVCEVVASQDGNPDIGTAPQTTRKTLNVTPAATPPAPTPSPPPPPAPAPSPSPSPAPAPDTAGASGGGGGGAFGLEWVLGLGVLVAGVGGRTRSVPCPNPVPSPTPDDRH
ncbi:MAG: hypothetical protein EKK53_22375 [Burkholderiales bacterium]|nr:MAG: hypothetical protein EKK53_22375 [Burkholderiales bacterium]